MQAQLHLSPTGWPGPLLGWWDQGVVCSGAAQWTRSPSTEGDRWLGCEDSSTNNRGA